MAPERNGGPGLPIKSGIDGPAGRRSAEVLMKPPDMLKALATAITKAQTPAAVKKKKPRKKPLKQIFGK